jgi:hypothetical protein
MIIENDLVCNVENDSTYVWDLNKVMCAHNFMLCYRGKLNQNIIKSILAMTEKKMNSSEEDFLFKKKVFNVLVECLQNITNSDISIEGGDSLLMIGKAENDYEIYSGSIILKSKKTELKKILNSITSFGKEELKRLYKLLMIKDELFSNNSIEVALIDIAKKSGNKIEFEFKDLDEQTTFFSLKTIITSEN